MQIRAFLNRAASSAFVCSAMAMSTSKSTSKSTLGGVSVSHTDGDGSAVAAAISLCSCRSNATHIVWKGSGNSNSNSNSNSNKKTETNQMKQRHRLGRQSSGSSNGCPGCQIQTLAEAKTDLYQYLRAHVMPFDLPFLQTLGFNDDNNDDDDSSGLPDGLGNGLIGQTIDYALRAKIEFSYSDNVPKYIWREYVLNYANVNEARSNWRPLFWNKTRHLVGQDNDNDNDTIMKTVVHKINRYIWQLLAPAGQNVLYFKSGSTPLIFDPMSILAFGYASCTGISIVLVNALRTLGIPARMAGTAAWNQNRTRGNHNWVEVYHQGKWHFLEAAVGTDPQGRRRRRRQDAPPSSVDDLDSEPCHHWFCSPLYFTNNPHNTTKVFAARLESWSYDNNDHKSRPFTFYPMAWEWNNPNVPGEDVTASYHEICSQCQ